MHFFLRRGRHRTQGATVEGLAECDHFVSSLATGLGKSVTETPRGFDQAVIGLGSGVGKEHLAGQLDMVLDDGSRQLRLLRNLIEIRHVNQRCGLR